MWVLALSIFYHGQGTLKGRKVAFIFCSWPSRPAGNRVFRYLHVPTVPLPRATLISFEVSLYRWQRLELGVHLPVVLLHILRQVRHRNTVPNSFLTNVFLCEDAVQENINIMMLKYTIYVRRKIRSKGLKITLYFITVWHCPWNIAYKM